jgi:hypothetical protein
MSTLSRSVLAIAAVASLALASASFAAPPPRGHGGPAAHAPHSSHRAPQHRSAPPPRRDDHHHHSRHSTRNAVAAGVAAGAILFGLAELARSSNSSSNYTYQQDPATLYQSQGSQVVRYVYWCDEPRGYYPDVRSCPTGWRQVPAQ